MIRAVDTQSKITGQETDPCTGLPVSRGTMTTTEKARQYMDRKKHPRDKSLVNWLTLYLYVFGQMEKHVELNKGRLKLKGQRNKRERPGALAKRGETVT